jgi:hypothetical protein
VPNATLLFGVTVMGIVQMSTLQTAPVIRDGFQLTNANTVIVSIGAVGTDGVGLIMLHSVNVTKDGKVINVQHVIRQSGVQVMEIVQWHKQEIQLVSVTKAGYQQLAIVGLVILYFGVMEEVHVTILIPPIHHVSVTVVGVEQIVKPVTPPSGAPMEGFATLRIRINPIATAQKNGLEMIVPSVTQIIGVQAMVSATLKIRLAFPAIVMMAGKSLIVVSAIQSKHVTDMVIVKKMEHAIASSVGAALTVQYATPQLCAITPMDIALTFRINRAFAPLDGKG